MGVRNEYGFPKEEHLCGKTRIDSLFANGKSLFVYPFRVVYQVVPEREVKVRCLVNAPKKRFKHAVDRNRVKRLMRETYRLNKRILVDVCSQKNCFLDVAFCYVGDKVEPYKFFEKKMIITLKKLTDLM